MKFKSYFFEMMRNGVAIYCNTKKEIEALIVELEKLGLKWFDGESLKGTKVSADECCVEVRDYETVIVNTRDWYERRGYLIRKFPDLIEADNHRDIVQNWSDEHQQKTYKEDFFEKFPNAPKYERGYPMVNPKYIYGDIFENTAGIMDCWDKIMEE